jgi:mRNA-degrading endonuclease toxin of MazEF toxin-antitoxin module
MVTVAAAGDYGKPWPAVVVQTDAFPEKHASVVVCQMTSDVFDAPISGSPSIRAAQMGCACGRK